MQGPGVLFDRVDATITSWLSRHSIAALRVGLGVVFLWFGALKFFSGLSPGQELATGMMDVLTFGLVPAGAGMVILATTECAVGLGLITGRFVRVTLLLLVLQLFGKMLPLFFFPAEVFTRIPYAPTLEGQSIIKNVVLVGAGLVIGATARGGYMVAGPEDERDDA